MSKKSSSSQLPMDDSDVASPVGTPSASAPAQSTTSMSLSRTDVLMSLQKSEAVQKSEYLACRPNAELIEALSANGAGDAFRLSDLPSATIPSGGKTKWMIESLAGAEACDTIDGIVVYYATSGVLWANSNPTPGTKPLLRTDNLIDAFQVSDDFGELDQQAIEECFLRVENGRNVYDWQKLPYNQWGSGKNGGKRCKEQRLLCILRKNDFAPVFIRVPPSSVGIVSKFFRQLTLVKQLPHYRVVASLSLTADTAESGEPYAKVNIKMLGQISQDEGKYIKTMFTEALGGAMSEAVEGVDSTSNALDPEGVLAG